MRSSYFLLALLTLFLMLSSQVIKAKEVVTVYTLDGRKATFYLYTQQPIKDLKILISKRWAIPFCNLRLTNGSDDSDILMDDARIGSIGDKDRIKIHDVSSPLNANNCQKYDHPAEL